jgi:hypothetical protein
MLTGVYLRKKQADTEKKLAALLSKRGLTEEDLPGILSKLQDLSNKKKEKSVVEF